MSPVQVTFNDSKSFHINARFYVDYELIWELHLTLKTRQFNRLTFNDPYMGRTAPLTSKRCIVYIYSTNIGTEYFKHALYSPFFFSSKCSVFHNANLFGSCIIHILYRGCAKIKKKKSSGAKELILSTVTQYFTQYSLYDKFNLS